jgi:hypothetical protein
LKAVSATYLTSSGASTPGLAAATAAEDAVVAFSHWSNEPNSIPGLPPWTLDDGSCLELVPLSGASAAPAALWVAIAGESMRFAEVVSFIPWKFRDGIEGMVGLGY